jgi:hypothetical protein
VTARAILAAIRDGKIPGVVTAQHGIQVAERQIKEERTEYEGLIAKLRADLAAAKFGSDTLLGERNRADAACVILAEAHQTARAEADAAKALLRYISDKGYVKDKITYDGTGLEDRINALLEKSP